MSKVVDIHDHLQLRSILNNAEKNLNLIADSLSRPRISCSNFKNAALEFTKAFLASGIPAFPVPLEDSDALYDVLSVDRTLWGHLVVQNQYYTNKGCHDLSIALAVRAECENSLIKVADGTGFPIYSAIMSADRQLVLDANGVHNVSDIIDSWQRNPADGQVVIKTTTVAELMAYSGIDDAGVEQVLEDFGALASFMLKELDSLTSEIDEDMDMDMDDDQDESPSI